MDEYVNTYLQNQQASKKRSSEEELNVYDTLVERLSRYIETLNYAPYVPEQLCIGYELAVEWYNWCVDNSYDYRTLGGIEISVDIRFPQIVAVIGSTKYGRGSWSKDRMKPTMKEFIDLILED